jgi:hypothetical protein
MDEALAETLARACTGQATLDQGASTEAWASDTIESSQVGQESKPEEATIQQGKLDQPPVRPGNDASGSHEGEPLEDISDDEDSDSEPMALLRRITLGGSTSSCTTGKAFPRWTGLCSSR